MPKWNQIELLEVGKIARLSQETAEDDVIFVVICTPDQHQMVLAMVGAAGWTEDHVCKVPIYKEANMTKRCLIISVCKKTYALADLEIPRPEEDTWFDTYVEDEWTMKDGKPLRGSGNIFLKII